LLFCVLCFGFVFCVLFESLNIGNKNVFDYWIAQAPMNELLTIQSAVSVLVQIADNGVDHHIRFDYFAFLVVRIDQRIDRVHHFDHLFAIDHTILVQIVEFERQIELFVDVAGREDRNGHHELLESDVARRSHIENLFSKIINNNNNNKKLVIFFFFIRLID